MVSEAGRDYISIILIVLIEPVRLDPLNLPDLPLLQFLGTRYTFGVIALAEVYLVLVISTHPPQITHLTRPALP